MCNTCGNSAHDDLDDDLPFLGDPAADAIDGLTDVFGLEHQRQAEALKEFYADFGITGEKRPGYVPDDTLLHYEPCKKCRGTGRFIGYTGRALGPCYTCKGAGKMAYKQSAETRAANREAEARRKAKAQVEAAAPWIEANAVEYGSLIALAKTNGFFADLLAKLMKWGSLTDRQTDTIRREMAKTQLRQEQRDNAPVLDKAFDRVIAAFERAREKQVKLPKMRLGDFYISWNPKAIYVKSLTRTSPYDGQREYLGKIVDGKFLRARACTDEDQKALLAVVADPEAAANAYGQRTGTCSICGLELTAAESIERSIGPICYAKYFG